MDYRINWDCCSGVFAIPDAVADKGLKLAGGKALKVLIYFMRNRRLPDVPEDIGVTSEDIEDALSYWEQLGIIVRADASAADIKAAVPEEDRSSRTVTVIAPVPEQQSSLPQQPATVIARPHKALLPTEISERIESSEETRFLFTSAESSLKRALTFDDQRTILWFLDHLGMSADIIIMLIAFCCQIGYTNMGRIEKVAIDWHDKNITTHEMAENEMLMMQKAFSFEGKVQSRLKLQSKLTASQKRYIDEWALMDIAVDMVELAYDKTVDAIGKPSFNYMNKIITKWFENGIKDAAAAASFDDLTKPGNKTARETRQNKKPNTDAPSYDLDALFEHAMNTNPTVRKKEAR